MTYDALGRWVEKASGSTYTQAVYAPTGERLIYANGQTAQQAYVRLPGGAIAQYSGATLNAYWHPNWLGTPRLYSSGSRTVLADVAYAPFGEQYIGTPQSTFFTGVAASDESADTKDFWARELHSTEGRWLSPDPAGLAAVDLKNPQSWNRYAYVGNNPLGTVDPSGMWGNPVGATCQWDASYQTQQCALNMPSGFVNNLPGAHNDLNQGETGYIQTIVGPSITGQTPPNFLFGGLPPSSTGATICFCTANAFNLAAQLVNSAIHAAEEAQYNSWDVGVGLDVWSGQQQLWTNTARVGQAAAIVTGAAIAPLAIDVGVGLLSGDAAAVSNGGTRLPPGWNEAWRQMWNTSRGGGLHWFDEEGGEWRYHAPDRWHPDPHWDYNSWDNWNSPWQNINP